MSRSIVVTDAVYVPARALSVRAVRASGPGGQNVNKVASKVDLRVDLDAIAGLSDPARRRLRMLAGRRLDARGHLVVMSQATRDQFRNLELARERVRELVSAALHEPRPRRPTRAPAAIGEARLAGKKRRAEVKRGRARPARED